MGRILDGLSEHMKNFEDDYTLFPESQRGHEKGRRRGPQGVAAPKILCNYLPVGSEEARSSMPTARWRPE